MKKMILLAILMFSFVGFSQTKVLYVHSTGNSDGFEAIWNVKSPKYFEGHQYALGAGATLGSGFDAIYGILTNDITPNFSIGVRGGGWSLDGCNDMKLYYGATTYLQLNGKAKGFVVNWGVDRFRQCSVGLGYKF